MVLSSVTLNLVIECRVNRPRAKYILVIAPALNRVNSLHRIYVNGYVHWTQNCSLNVYENKNK